MSDCYTDFNIFAKHKYSFMNSAKYKFLSNLSLWIVGIAIYSLFYQATYNLIVYRMLLPYTSVSDAMSNIIRNSIPIYIIFCLDYLIIFHLTNKHLSSFMKIFVDAVLIVIVMVGTNMIYTVTLQVELLDWSGTTFNSVITFFVLSTIYYIRHYQDTLRKQAVYRSRLLEYKYAMLKSQVSPHFLFNSLNVLYALVKNQSDSSLEFIESLSQIYHYVLIHQNVDLVNLKEELDFAQYYGNILMLRYKNQLIIKYINCEHSTNHKIVPYSLQLTIENVVKHNVMSISHPINIFIELDGTTLIVSNTYVPKNSPTQSGVGLSYLTQLYGLQAKRLEYGVTDNRFVVKIPLL